MNTPHPDSAFGVPDDDSPEWREDDFLWAVRGADFPDIAAVTDFLRAREAFLRQAEALGLARSALLPFEPTKPGFIERATAALAAIAEHGKHAAE
jgi:hypothetical protein